MFLYHGRSATQLNPVWQVLNSLQYSPCIQVSPSILTQAPERQGQWPFFHRLQPLPQSCWAHTGWAVGVSKSLLSLPQLNPLIAHLPPLSLWRLMYGMATLYRPHVGLTTPTQYGYTQPCSMKVLFCPAISEHTPWVAFPGVMMGMHWFVPALLPKIP